MVIKIMSKFIATLNTALRVKHKLLLPISQMEWIIDTVLNEIPEDKMCGNNQPLMRKSFISGYNKALKDVRKQFTGGKR